MHRRYPRILGIATVGANHRKHPIALLEIADALPDFFYQAGDFTTEGQRKFVLLDLRVLTFAIL